MEELLKRELRTKTWTKFGGGGIPSRGYICTGQGYETDAGKVFVKSLRRDDDMGGISNMSNEEVRVMFDGEYASLQAILYTNTVRVPKPIKVVDEPDGEAVLVMEYLEMQRLSTYEAELGRDLASLHLSNAQKLKNEKSSAMSIHKSDEAAVDKFGFHTRTCCGYIPQENAWCDDWATFFSKKLQGHVELVTSKFGDREALECWSKLQVKITDFFRGLEITPALLHGDFWHGNVGETREGAVVFDPASFYGHHEFDLSMFGGFGRKFYDAYHQVIPKCAGFELRQQLYQLFHYLNHWYHFGGDYRSSALEIMKRLIR